ncbi:AbrB family transcriptional regulator [Arvimicrobium flavum]|uniref:AbrB family transcriptional regulator n=1 Tax=Arvimicrobium flavum TaxID=3393320 RepID=UPI00237B170A|nr:AbrB family transcriptional regulator [Mesorhizobium shangrilense]
MTDQQQIGGGALLDTAPKPLQWLALAGLSLLFGWLLEIARLPAAALVGPMLAGIAIGVNGGAIRAPKAAFDASQAVIGVLIAMSISPEIFLSFAADWQLFALVVVATVAASSFLGWLISRWKVLPGTTGVWGASPGASTVMVLMAEAFGADARLVAFMQYLRVIMVSVAAASVAGLWLDTSKAAAPSVAWFPSIDPADFLATLGVALAGGLFGRVLRLPSPHFFGTFLLAAALHLAFSASFQLPPWLVTASYVVIGWWIGLNFTRSILRHATRALPQIVASILALMAFCGGLAWILSAALGIDPLTAYLATSPGGMDTVAIIAVASQSVDISFVMALQLARFLVVLFAGPSIARLVARSVKE